jgi:hypothetical protein
MILKLRLEKNKKKLFCLGDYYSIRGPLTEKQRFGRFASKNSRPISPPLRKSGVKKHWYPLRKIKHFLLQVTLDIQAL